MAEPNERLVQQGLVAIRRMSDTHADYALMARWLTDERVLEFFEGRDNPFPLERIIEKYSPRVLTAEDTIPCFILYDDQPIGFIQYYLHDKDALAAFDLPAGQAAYGMDMFIGEPEFWNRGIGTTVVTALSSYLFDTLHADTLTLDPETWNTRAIRAYEKCGFRKHKLLLQSELHEGELRDCWLLLREKVDA